MAVGQLVSTVFMGLLVVVVVTWLTLSPRWHRNPVRWVPVGASEADDEGWSFRELNGPLGWTLLFVALVFGSVAAVVAVGTGPVGPQANPVVVLGGGLAALLVGYLLVGVYAAAKGRGHPSSLAAAESASVGGVLFLIAVLVQLIG